MESLDWMKYYPWPCHQTVLLTYKLLSKKYISKIFDAIHQIFLQRFITYWHAMFYRSVLIDRKMIFASWNWVDLLLNLRSLLFKYLLLSGVYNIVIRQIGIHIVVTGNSLTHTCSVMNNLPSIYTSNEI